MKTVRNWGVFVYLGAVLLAVGLLFAITAVPRHSTDIFPNPSADELVQVVQWYGKALRRAANAPCPGEP